MLNHSQSMPYKQALTINCCTSLYHLENISSLFLLHVETTELSNRKTRFHWWKKGLWSRFATAISRGCATATERARLKAPPFSRGCLRTATKGPSTWAPGGRRGGGPLVAVLLANRD